MSEIIKNLLSPEKLAHWIEIGTALLIITVICLTLLGATAIAFKRLKRNTTHASSLTALSLTQSIINYALVLITLIASLQAVGINASALIASVGVIGFAISFGAQNLIRDFISGLFILFENQFVEGERVEIAGQSGRVVKMGLRTTVVTSDDGALHIIPNGSITIVTNFSRK